MRMWALLQNSTGRLSYHGRDRKRIKLDGITDVVSKIWKSSIRVLFTRYQVYKEDHLKTALAILVPISITMGTVGLLAFFWSLRTKQYEYLEGAAVRILLNDDDE
jgi:cbb3-type cytochrome oxidase maturation protein